MISKKKKSRDPRMAVKEDDKWKTFPGGLTVLVEIGKVERKKNQKEMTVMFDTLKEVRGPVLRG